MANERKKENKRRRKRKSGVLKWGLMKGGKLVREGGGKGGGKEVGNRDRSWSLRSLGRWALV